MKHVKMLSKAQPAKAEICLNCLCKTQEEKDAKKP